MKRGGMARRAVRWRVHGAPSRGAAPPRAARLRDNAVRLGVAGFRGAGLAQPSRAGGDSMG